MLGVFAELSVFSIGCVCMCLGVCFLEFGVQRRLWYDLDVVCFKLSVALALTRLDVAMFGVQCCIGVGCGQS